MIALKNMVFITEHMVDLLFVSYPIAPMIDSFL